MRLENQVCTLEQAKRLKELGIEQNSLFVWTSDGQPQYHLRQGEHTCEDDYSAYTVAELGVMLPTGHDTMRLTEMGGEIWHGYDDDGNDCPLTEYYEVYRTEAQARAAMLIYLLENNLTTPEEVNNRLNNQ